MSAYKYSVVLPVCNEQEVLAELFRRVEKTMVSLGENFEIICVDDGSNDDSFKILEEKAREKDNCKVIKLSRNFGHQVAITAGLDMCKGEAVIILDADLQDPPEFIPELIGKWQQGYDVVYAVRKKRKENFLRKCAIKIAYRVIHGITQINIPVDTGDFRLMSRRVVDALNSSKERVRYLRGLSCWVGFKQVGIEYKREKRYAGKTKYPLWKLIKLAFDGVTSFSRFPLTLAAYLGFFVSIFSAVFVAYLVYRKVTGLGIAGWASVMVSIFFMGGVQLFTVGVLGEYVGRIYDEVKQRPMYLIDRKINL